MKCSISVDELKSQIRAKEMSKADLKADYEAAVGTIDKAIVELKIQLANLVLNEQVILEENDKLVTLVSIQFNDRGKLYDYFWDSNDPVAAGDSVVVESTWGGLKAVTVVDVKRQEMDLSELSNYKCAYPQGTKY